MLELEKILSEIMKRYRKLSEEELKTVSRWDIPAYIVWSSQDGIVSTPCNSISDLDNIDIDANACVNLITSRSHYHFFPAESAAMIGVALKQMSVVNNNSVLICTDQKYLDNEFNNILSSSNVETIDSIGISIRSNGKVKWDRDVPRWVSNALWRKHTLEENELKEYCLRFLYRFPPSMQKSEHIMFNRPFGVGFNDDVDNNQEDISFEELKDFFSALCLGHVVVEKENVNNVFTEKEKWALQNIVFSKWQATSGFYLSKDFNMLQSIMMLWNGLGELPRINRDNPSAKEQTASIMETAENLGIDSAIEALEAGVGIEDILA